MPGKKLAFVVPWYGVNVVGGAETMARRIAEQLATRGVEVEALTTCAADSGSSQSLSFYDKGESIVNGVLVRRFEAMAANSAVIDELTRKLKRGWQVSEEDEQRFVRALFHSPRLIDFVASHGTDYWLIYTPYWCGTTYWGCKANAENSFILPCLHDEPTAHLRVYRNMLQKVRGLMFYSQPEMDLAQRLYGIGAEKCTLIGGAIDADVVADAERFRKMYNVRDEFVLSLGRKADNKNTPMLVNYFAQYKRRNGGGLRLVLMGPGKVDIPGEVRADILDLGVVPESDKDDACAAATVLCQPSVNESFSIAIMEAWACGAPVLVHADCAVTVDHCIRSDGGLFFKDYSEFEECLNYLVQAPIIRRKMGVSGRNYVRERCRFDSVVDRLLQGITAWTAPTCNTGITIQMKMAMNDK